VASSSFISSQTHQHISEGSIERLSHHRLFPLRQVFYGWDEPNAHKIGDYTKTLEVEGISAPVEIVRDNANVPHIFASNDADVFFGLGYAHAQDRLWQMTMLRRTAQGRLSEVFGRRTLSIDTLLRRLDIYRLASLSVASQDARTTDALGAYAAGVNMRIAEINARSLGRGAPS